MISFLNIKFIGDRCGTKYLFIVSSATVSPQSMLPTWWGVHHTARS